MEPSAPTRVHRVVSGIAALSLLRPLDGAWMHTTPRSPVSGLLIGLCFPLLLAWVAAALTVRRSAILARVDVGGLVVAALTNADVLARAVVGHTPLVVDESILSHLAARTLAGGANPYLPSWHDQVAHAPTLLMGGGIADRYGYPPLDLLLGAGVARIAPGATEVVVVAELALVASAVLLFVILPRDLRPLAVVTVYAVGPLTGLAADGYPIVLATPLLLFVLHRWTGLGAGGRLGRRGVAQAVALGLACATQQLVWFLVPFLLVALWRLRRGELGRGAAAGVTVGFAGVAASAFAAVNLPFAIAGPTSWLTGVLDPLRQHAFFDGPGITNVTLRIADGSGGLDFYRYAALLLFLTLLVTVALFPAQLGPAALIFPFAVFWISMRSQVMYYEALTPLAVVLLASTRRAAFATARPVRLPAPARRAVPAVGAVAVLACLVTAIVWPAPLRLQVLDVSRGARTQRVDRIEVRVSNVSGEPLVPHFATDLRVKSSSYWRVVRGARRLAPGATVTYLLAPPRFQRTRMRNLHRLYVVTDSPETLSVGTLRPG